MADLEIMLGSEQLQIMDQCEGGEYMISVDLYVPMLNETYDFEWNGETAAGEVVQQSMELLKRQEGICFEEKSYYLYALDLGKMMDPDRDLNSQGVLAGEPFVLV